MKRFIEGDERSQVTLLPECLDDYILMTTPCASSTSSSTR
jgi:hypothetical protein